MKRLNLRICGRICMSLLMVICVLMPIGVMSVEAQASQYGEIYVAGNSENYPIEAKIDGRWVGMMPELYSKIEEQTGINITYVDVGAGERESFVANEQSELVGALTLEEGQYYAATYDLVLSDAVFSYNGVDYYIGYTTLAPNEIQDVINQSIAELSDFERTEIALVAAAKMFANQLPGWVYITLGVLTGLLMLVTVIFCVATRRMRKSVEGVGENTDGTVLKELAIFENSLISMRDNKIDSLYYVVLLEIDNSAVKWLCGYEDAENAINLAILEIERKITEQCTMIRASDNSLLLTMQANSETDAATRIDSMMRSVATELTKRYNTVNIPITAGACLVSYYNDSFQNIMRIVQYGCNTAKAQNESYVICTDDKIKKLFERSEISQELVEQSELTDFVIHLLPTVKPETGEVTGAHALARWDHKEKGLLQPSLFLDYFETSGKVMELNYWVFDRLCSWISQKNSIALRSMCITCKMSISNLRDPEFKSIITHSLTANDVPRNILGVEISSEAVMDNDSMVEQNIKFLCDMGVELVLDHFGAKSTYLPAFVKYPINRIKVDPILSGALDTDEGRAIVSGIVRISQQLGKQVICEMVQTREQAEIFSALGVEHLSGYHFYRPMPTREFGDLIGQQNKHNI